LKAIRSDNGREYLSKAFQCILTENGIKRQLMVPHTPQQNGVAERANRTLVEMARTMMIHAGVGHSLWAEAINTAAYLRNRAETSALSDVTPFESWTGRKPYVSHLKIFGSKAIVLNKSTKRKFSAKGEENILVGYSDASKGYRLFNPIRKNICVARDVIVFENDQDDGMTAGQAVPSPDVQLVEMQHLPVCVAEGKKQDDVFQVSDKHVDDVAPVEQHDSEGEASSTEDNEATEVRGPGRPKKIYTGKPGRPRKQYNMVNGKSTDEVPTPRSVKEAETIRNSEEWRTSMQKELESLRANKTWSLVDLPAGEKAIGSKA